MARIRAHRDNPEVRQAVRLHKSGMDAAAIAEHMMLSRHTIVAWLEARGYGRDMGRNRKINGKEAAKHYKGGETLQEVGDRYGVSASTIASAMDREGIKRRKQGHQPNKRIRDMEKERALKTGKRVWGVQPEPPPELQEIVWLSGEDGAKLLRGELERGAEESAEIIPDPKQG